jgi:hypothetical protein
MGKPQSQRRQGFAAFFLEGAHGVSFRQLNSYVRLGPLGNETLRPLARRRK